MIVRAICGFADLDVIRSMAAVLSEMGGDLGMLGDTAADDPLTPYQRAYHEKHPRANGKKPHPKGQGGQKRAGGSRGTGASSSSKRGRGGAASSTERGGAASSTERGGAASSTGRGGHGGRPTASAPNVRKSIGYGKAVVREVVEEDDDEGDDDDDDDDGGQMAELVD